MILVGRANQERVRAVGQSSALKLSAHFAKSAILEAAMQVFSEHGIQETRVEDLIVAANISRRTFYKYFNSKEEVLAALYELVTGQMLELLKEARGGGGPSLEALLVGVDLYFEFHAANGKLLRLLVEHAIRSDSLLYPRRRWLRAELAKALDETVKAAGGHCETMVFYALISALEGLSLHLLETNASEEELEQAKKIIHGLTRQLLMPGR